MICWGWGDQRRKGEHSRFLATELGMTLESLRLRSSRICVDLAAIYWLSWQLQALAKQGMPPRVGVRE